MAYTTINKSTEHFNTQLWTGNSTANRSLTGFGFQPDFVWIKNRDTTRYHVLMDAVRGASKIVYSNESDAEVTDTNQLESFDSDGITVGTDNNVNKNGSPHVGWTWKANGQGSSNTDGSITSTASVNTTAGFSVVKYGGTGSSATVGHGLGSVPKVIFFKCRGNTDEWRVYHASIGATKFLRLNGTSATTDSPTYMFNGTTPTSSVFSIGAGNSVNNNSHIAYCFAEKQGYSKFGSYTGNGNADGTFVYTGFKPAWLLIKRTEAAAKWFLWDNKREPFNLMDSVMVPNSNEVENTDTAFNMDFLSNGFKLRNNFGDLTASGEKFIYMAFGQSLVGSNNVPCTAR